MEPSKNSTSTVSWPAAKDVITLQPPKALVLGQEGVTRVPIGSVTKKFNPVQSTPLVFLQGLWPPPCMSTVIVNVRSQSTASAPCPTIIRWSFDGTLSARAVTTAKHINSTAIQTWVTFTVTPPT